MWPLLQQVMKNNDLNYMAYRCIDPVAEKTGKPWYPITNICPCDPTLSNITGRGFTSCPMGISDTRPRPPLYSLSQVKNQLPKSKQEVTGNVFNQNQFVPPQLDPRPLTLVGYEWRSAN